MIKKIQLLCLFVGMVVLCHAQQITVSAPTHVPTGENFRIAYTIDTQDVEEFRAANVPAGLEIIAGPYTSRQSSYQMVNGHTSSSSSVTLTYTLYAEKAGTYTIGSARAKVGGKTIKSKAVRIQVSGSPKSSNGAPNMHGDDDESAAVNSAGTPITGKDLFVKVTASKQHVCEQEPVLLTYKVYTLVELTSLDGKMPDMTGFHTQEIPLPQQKSFHIENVNGRNYRCVTWSQYVLYPQMTGVLKVPSITFKGIVVQQNRNVDPFEAFFNGGSGYVQVKRNIEAPGLTITVDPLKNKPAGFSGGVGQFNISAQVNHTTLKAGEPLTYSVVVGGTGNLKLIKQPTVVFPKDFDKYDPKVTDKTKLTAKGIEGNMVYDFLVVPRNEGKYVIPETSLTYYDPATKSYRTIKTKPITINVGKGDGTANSSANFAAQKRDDILPIKTGDASLRSEKDFFFGSPSYWIGLLIPILAFIVLLVIFRKRAIDNADIVKMKGKHANKIATKRLKTANRLMKQGRQAEFYDEVLRALWDYVGNKLNMPVEQLSRENISEQLGSRNIKEETIATFLNALDECEFERYAPGDAAGNMDKTYHSAMKAITDIEEEMKHAKKARHASTTLLLLAVLAMAPLSSPAITKANADAEYAKGNYQQAIIDYKELLSKGVSAELYYNLGNAYYRTNEIAQAVLAYERALLLSPGDNDIRTNLQFVRTKTIDKITPVNEMFFITWLHTFRNLTDADGWARWSIASTVVALVLLLVFLFASRVFLRKVGFYGAVLSLVVFVVCVVCATRQKYAAEHRNGAIVISSSVSVKQTPADSSNDVFVIHEGTRVDITDSTMKGWRAIKTADGREGWLKTSAIEVI